MRKHIRKEKIYLFLLLATMVLSVRAQNSNGLTFLSNVSQASLINPAYQNTTEQLVVGLPVISGMNMQWDNNFAINNIISKNFVIDFEEFYQSVDGNPVAFASSSLPLIYLSLKRNKQTFGFSISDKVVANSYFDKEILQFLSEGLLPYYGRDDSFDPISFKAKYFRELSISYAVQVQEKLSVGIRPKILFEKFYYHIDNCRITTTTYAQEENFAVIPQGSYMVSGPVEIIYDEETESASVKPNIKPADYFFKLKNMGAAIDLGLSYKPNNQSEIQFSVTDLGFTSHKKNTYHIIFNDSLHYQKHELYQSSDSLASNYLSPEQAILRFRNSVPYITTPDLVTKRRYELLPVQINLQLKYKVSKNTWFGASNNYIGYKNHSNNYLSGFISTFFGTHFETAGSLTLNNFKKISPGLSCSYTGQKAQIYLSTNNILTMIKPTSSKNLNLCFGVNILFTSN